MGLRGPRKGAVANPARPSYLETVPPDASPSLKAFELFEREAQVLLGLRHEGIPAFVDLLRADVRRRSCRSM